MKRLRPDAGAPLFKRKTIALVLIKMHSNNADQLIEALPL